MKDLVKGKILEKFIAVLLVIATILPYFPMSVFAASNDEVDIDSLITLTANWKGLSADERAIGTTNDSYALEYYFAFTGSSSGFRNVIFEITTNKLQNVVDSVTIDGGSSGNGYAMINPGTALSGEASIRFGNKDNQEERTVYVTLKGEYKPFNSENYVNFEKVIELDAMVTPATQRTDYVKRIDWKGSRDYQGYGEKPTYNTSNSYITDGWYANYVTATYPIQIHSYSLTKNLTLSITLNRITNGTSKITDGVDIDWGGLIDLFGDEPTVTVNSNGSRTYTFTREANASVSDLSSAFFVKDEYIIRATYTIPNADPRTNDYESSTYLDFVAELQGSGFEKVKNYGQEELINLVNKPNTAIQDKKYVPLCGYTPGNHAWKSYQYSAAESSTIYTEDVEALKQNTPIDLVTKVSINRYAGGTTGIYEGTLKFGQPTIGYLSGGRYVSKTLTGNQVRLKAVRNIGFNPGSSKLEINGNEEDFTDSYTVAQGVNENEFNITMLDHLAYSNAYEITFTVNPNALGLTSEEIDNISGISFQMGTGGSWCYGAGGVFFNYPVGGTLPFSYFDMSVSNWDTTPQQTKPVDCAISLSMNRPSGAEDHEVVRNENPIFYIGLPSAFKYTYKLKDIKLYGGNNQIQIDYTKFRTDTIDGKTYIVIPCIGTYDSSEMDRVTISIPIKKSNIDLTSNQYSITASMITDNEDYKYERTENINELKKSDGTTPADVMERDALVSVVGARVTKAYTMAIAKDGEFGNNDPETVERGEIVTPKIVESGDTIEVKSGIEISESISSISIIGRLPFAGNTLISDDDEKLIADDYVLPYQNSGDFMYEMESKIIGMNKGDIVSQITLEDVTIKGVYKNTGELISPDKYSIYYSTSVTANFDSPDSVFVPYVEGTTDLSAVGAKNIKVVFNDISMIDEGDSIYISYEATMPNASGMVGAVSSTRFERTLDGQVSTLDAPAVYVINGSLKGDLVVTKKFEDYAEGHAPNGESLSGIVFKLYYYENGEKIYLKDSNDADLTAMTNLNGVATFSDIPAGHYFLEEVNTFTNYSGLEQPTDVQIEESLTTNYTAVNKLKTGTITVDKVWQGASESQGEVEFTIVRNTREGDTSDLSYSKSLKTGPDDVAVFEDVPYGTYTITETGIDGWTSTEESKTVTIDSSDETGETTFTNVPSRGNVRFVKTIDAPDTVVGLTFHIVGRGKITYKDTSDQYVNTDYDITVTVGETDATTIKTITEGNIAANDISVVKSNDNKQVVITLNNVYVGRFNVDEINIPTLPAPNDDLTKFVTTSSSGELIENGQTLPLGMTNSWRTGTIRVTKTALEGVDLTQFRIRIRCSAQDSVYGVAYDRTFDIPDDTGVLTVSGLYMGTYTVEEIESDYYYAQYGANKVATPATVDVESGKVSTVEIYNQSANGYVKVLKTLEGKDANETKGIKFRLTGKDVTGAAIADDATKPEEGITKTITSTTEYQGKTYGVVEFGPILAGGEYELTELEETVPDYFVPVESMTVDVKKTNTQENPVIFQIDNKRGIGNLEITTKTIPEGGPLSPIEYEVTEIKIGDNNKINKIGATTTLTAVSGFAEIRNLNAGMYVVELKTVPQGYEKDYPQIVEVPVGETGYAEFEIERIDVADSGLTVEKEILNKSGNPATAADFENAQIPDNDSFEAVITSEDGNKIYYIFFDKDNPGKLKGLPAGTYSIEEVYKPKYLTTKYALKDGNNYNEISANNAGKYIFTIADSSATATIKITNTINTDFGFGGQDSKDNFGKILTERVNKATRAVFYIADEDGAVVPGAKFKIYDDRGNEVQLSFENNTYVVSTDKKLFVYGLPVGNYTIKTLEVPEGYELPEDSVGANMGKAFTVYDGATVVTRVELWKVKPRGKSLTLSTKYVDDNGAEQFVPRSKYKILDTTTGKVLKFEKTASGDYVRSKSDAATDTISLRKGSVTVKGIEVGDYQLGLVDLTEQYGVINTEPEVLEVTEGSVINKKVMVEKRAGFKKAAIWTPDYYTYSFLGITEKGEMYTTSSDYELENIVKRYPELKNVKVNDFCAAAGGYQDYNFMTIVDDEGKVWTNYYGYDTNSVDFSELVCISNIEGNPLENVKIEKLFHSAEYGAEETIYAIDTDGKIWRWGNTINESGNNVLIKTPECFSNNTILEDAKIVQISANSNYNMAIDDLGNLYYWGGNNNYIHDIYDSLRGENTNILNTPVCITACEDANLYNVKIKFVDVYSYENAYFIDYDGNLWAAGSNYNGKFGNSSTNSYTYNDAICLTTDPNNSLYNKKIEYVDCSSYYLVYAIDSDGKLWGWGYQNTDYGIVRYADSQTFYQPICISDLEYNELETAKLKSVAGANGTYGVAVDENGELWFWGYSNMAKPIGRRGSNPPERIDAPFKSYFDLFEIKDIKITGNYSAILDSAGRLWTDNGTTDFLSTENGAELENTAIKDYVYSGNNGAVIGSKGELWIFGEINAPYAYKGEDIYNYNNDVSYDNYRGNKPICITNVSDSVLYNKEIVYAALSKSEGTNSAIAVIDKDGKIYTAGGKYANNLGYAPQNLTYQWPEMTKFECLNNKYESIENVQFTKVYVYDYNTMIALDTEGNLWSWGYKDDYSIGVIPPATSDYTVANYYDCIKPTKLSINAKIVDMQIYNNVGIAVDEDGNVYYWGNYWDYNGYYNLGTSQTPKLVDSTSTPIYGKKIVKVGVGSYYHIAMDENGEVFIDSTNSNIQSGSLVQSSGIIAKDFYNSDGTIVIRDIDDEFWVIGAGSAVGYNKTTAVPEKITGVQQDPLYGLNIIKTIDNNTFIAQEGEKQVLYELSGREIVNKITLKQFESHTNTTDLSKSYYMCIDENNNLYIKNSSNNQFTQITVLVNDANLPFANILKVHDNFALVAAKDINRIYLITNVAENSQSTSIISTANGDLNTAPENITGAWCETFLSNMAGAGNVVNVVFMQHSNGNLYVRSLRPDLSNKSITGLGTTSAPTSVKQITGYTGAKIVDMCMGSDIVLCLDEDKNLWAWGNGCIGNGEATGSTTPVIVKGNIEKIYYDKNQNIAIAIDADKNVWTWGTGNTGNGSTTGSITPEKITNITNAKEVVMNYLGVYVLTENGHVWTWGDNRYGQLGSTNMSVITTPVDLVNESGIDAIDKIIAYNNYCVDAISTSGKLYGWGYRSYDYRTPTLIDSDVLNAKVEDKYLIKTNGVMYRIQDTLSITEQYGNIVKQDGKIYNHTADGDTCINDSQYLTNQYGKKFILIKDSKYNN